MRFTYDSTVDAAHIWLVDDIDPGRVSRGELLSIGGEGTAVLVDLDAAGRILRFEFLGASKLLPAELLAPSREESRDE